MSAAGTDVRADEKAAFLERLRSFVGTPARPPWKAPDPVNEAMIRQFCEVMGDGNPVYTDRSWRAPPCTVAWWLRRSCRTCG